MKSILNWISTWDWGNVADWLSGVGSVLAILFVYLQIKQQTDQHNEEKGHNLEIALSNRLISKEIGPGATIIGEETEIFFWATNSGMMPSSFKYIDVYTSENFEILKSNHAKSAVDHKLYTDPEGLNLTFKYASGYTKNKFEKIFPGDISEEITILSENIIKNPKGQSKKLYIVYMDVLGVIYGKPFNIN
ncbi:hypothetical protein [Leuconostoc pseudomesenteroides]|uniref:hypothetical protein n=1 Tax=Leuconostoc pseudomesenteroides TaxID=33968 RepID=UPI00345E9D50